MKDIYWVGIFIFLYWSITYIYCNFINFKDFDRKSTSKAYLLWFIGGIFGLHNYYLKLENKNKIYAISMLLFLVFAYFFSWKDERFLFEIIINFKSNMILSFLLTLIFFQYILDFLLMRFLVFKSNHAEKTSPVIDFSGQLIALRKEVKKVNRRIEEYLKKDFI